jgi:hypothetical protein
LALLSALILVVGYRLVADNRDFFDHNFVLTGDFAATSIGAYDAEHLSQFRGQASFNGYYHPGPALMYYRALVDRPARLAGVRNDAATVMASQVLLVAGVFALAFFGLRAAVGERHEELATLILAVWAVFQIEKPAFLASVWEPQVGSLIFFLALIFGAAAITSRKRRWLLAMVLAGGVVVQTQMTAALPVVVLYLAVAFFYFSNWRQLRTEVPWLTGTAAIAYSPVLFDLVFRKAENLGLILDYAHVSRGRPGQTTSAAWQIVQANLGWGAMVRILVVVLVAALAAAYAFHERQQDTDSWFERIGPQVRLGGLAVGGLICAFVFQRFLTDRLYSPPHVSAFAYMMGALFIASLTAALAVDLPPTLLSTVTTVVLAAPIVAAVAGPALRYAPESPESAFTSAALVRLRDDSQTALKKQTGPAVGISVDARSGREWLYGWRTAVGLGNLLRRAGVPYCLAEQGGADLYANYAVLEKYMKSTRCGGGNPGDVVEFSCFDKNAFGYARRGENTVLWGC